MTQDIENYSAAPGAGRDPSSGGALPEEWTPAFAGDRTVLRTSVVNEAVTWIGTPFHHAGRVKGAGVDCLMLLAEVYERAGVIGPIEPPFYVPDWHLHRDAEHYMQGLLHYARPVAAPTAGDIALFRFGRTFSHGAIVVEWPRLIHAYWSVGVVWGDATLYPLEGRTVRFFSPFTPGS